MINNERACEEACANTIKEYLESGNDVSTGNDKLDMFVGYIKRDIAYAFKNFDEKQAVIFVNNFLGLVRAFAKFSTIDKIHNNYLQVLLDNLVNAECEMYACRDECGWKPKEEVALSRDDLRTRMELYGIAKGTVFDNAGLAVADYLIGTIFDKPYYGCELRILKIIEACQKYAAKVFEYIPLVGRKHLLLDVEKSFYSDLSHQRNKILENRKSAREIKTYQKGH